MGTIEAHDQCLEFWKKQNILCNVILANNTEFKAVIKTYDRFTIVFKFADSGELGLFFKSGILGILPVGVKDFPLITKDKAKGFVFGVATSCLLVAGASAYADPVSKSITAVFNDIKIVVNGNAVTPKDSDGNVVQPFVFDGTTYLPVRAVAQALNQSVDWDGGSNTVYIGQKPAGKSTALSKLDYARTDQSSHLNFDGWTPNNSGKNDVFHLAGTQYSNGIGVYGSYIDSAYIVYNTNSQYKQLTGVFGLDDLAKNRGNDVGTLVIYGDDKEIYRSNKVLQGDKPVDVNVDITGVNQLKLVFDTSNAMYPVFANAALK
jgi:sRNA-binding regulator protein Hfq